jgi:hypothetical protein
MSIAPHNVIRSLDEVRYQVRVGRGAGRNAFWVLNPAFFDPEDVGRMHHRDFVNMTHAETV